MKNVTLNNIATINMWINPIPNKNGDRFVIKDMIRFIYKGKSIDIPAGFMWDGASIPKVAALTTGAGSSPAHLRASLIHDYLYTFGRTLGWKRKTADIIYKKILLECGKSSYTAYKEYRAVRWFAKKAYK